MSWFLMDGFSNPYILDRNKQRGEALVHMWGKVLSKVLEKNSFR